tara:strand:- start:618 stop:1172 length:555 start_codon:yes stop_codon:yes gene_type:complete
MPYSSKGFTEAYDKMVQQTSESLNNSLQNGDFIITDNSPCALTLKKYMNQFGNLKFKVLDPIEFLDDIILPNTNIIQKFESIYFHSPCSAERQEITLKAMTVAQHLAKNVRCAPEPACCGFAGDLGFFIPELTESASSTIKKKVEFNGNHNKYCSTSFTCEMGLANTTRKDFQSLLSIADECLK